MTASGPKAGGRKETPGKRRGLYYFLSHLLYPTVSRQAGSSACAARWLSTLAPRLSTDSVIPHLKLLTAIAQRNERRLVQLPALRPGSLFSVDASNSSRKGQLKIPVAWPSLKVKRTA